MAKHDNWETPPELFKTLDAEFSFDLDAAANDSNHLVDRYFTEQQNSLVQVWDGKAVWCNPPYSMLEEFTRKAYEQHLDNHNTIVMLLPLYTDTRWWMTYCTQAHEVRMLKGRLRFLEDGKVGKDSARFSSAVVVFKWIKGNHHGKGQNIWVWDWKS